MSMTTDLNWQFVGTGDFNGDGADDVLLRNSSTGAWYVYYMTVGTYAVASGTGAGIPIYSNADFVFQGTGDLNGDNKSEVVFRSTSTGIWYAGDFASHTVKALNGVYRSNHWQFQALMDINGDGKADLLLRDITPSDPFPGVWGVFVSGSSFNVTSVYVLNAYKNLSAISLAQVGDFNGDGTDDLLLHNSAMDGYHIFTINPPTAPSPGQATYAGNPALGASPWVVLK
jgi:hypothetical protein